MKTMNNQSETTPSPESLRKALRQRAEEMLQKKSTQFIENSVAVSPEEIRQTLHELRVHQIELEMQNDELRHTQLELEEARARYVDLYDLAPVGYCTLSEKGLILETNLTAANLLDVPRGALIHQPISRFILKDDQDVYYLYRQKLFETGAPQAYELRMTKRDGAVFWAHLAAIILQDADGMPICRVVLSDINQLKQAEAALRESEERYLLMLDSTNDGIAMYTIEGKILNINANLAKKIGKTKQELVGTNYNDFIPKKRYVDVFEQRKRIIEIFETGKEASFEDTCDGFTFSNRFYPVFTNGKISAATLFSTDITDRKRAEEEVRRNAELMLEAQILRRKEQEYLEILDGSTEGSWIVDCQSGITEYSNQWLERIGAENASDRDVNFYNKSLLHPEDWERVIHKRQFIFEKKLPKYKIEYRLKTVDSGYIWVLDQGKIIYNQNGDPAKIYGTSMDITDRKFMEEELKKQAADLEQKNKLITDFFINISHEFKTPVSILLLAIEMLEQVQEQGELDRPETTKYIAILRQNTLRLSKLVGNLLDITKIDAGFMTPIWDNVDIVCLLNNLVMSMENLTNKKGLKLNFNCSSKTKIMPIDSLIIERIVLNLVSNAIKHTPKGGYININYKDLGGKIIVSIKDNGEGIPADKRDIIFDRFRQVDTSFTRSSEGCGIGLTITKLLVEMLGGHIYLKSDPGIGSEFFVELPVLNINEKNQTIVTSGISIDNRIQMEFSDIDFN